MKQDLSITEMKQLLNNRSGVGLDMEVEDAEGREGEVTVFYVEERTETPLDRLNGEDQGLEILESLTIEGDLGIFVALWDESD